MSCAAVRIRCRRGRSSWVEALCRIGRAHRGLRGDHQTAGGTDLHPERSGGPERQRRMAKPGYFVSRCKGPRQGRRKIAGRSHCRAGPPAVRSPSRRPGARLCPASWATPDRLRGHRRADVHPVSAVAHSMKRTTSCGASWVRRAARRSSMPKVRRSSLKSPSLGDHAIASMPAASARSVRAVTAASPAASASRAM